MKKFLTLLCGLLFAAVIGFAQGKWEQAGVTPYGTGGVNRSGERIDNSYNAGSFKSEVKSNDKNNPYVYFRNGRFNTPPKTFRPGETFTVEMSLSLKRHSGSGTPNGTAGAAVVNGKAGSGTSVSNAINISGKDKQKGATVTLTVPTRSAAGGQFSIVYACLDMKVVYLYKWVEPEKTAVAPVEAGPAVEEPEQEMYDGPMGEETGEEGLYLDDGTILPPEDGDEPAEEPESVEETAPAGDFVLPAFPETSGPAVSEADAGKVESVIEAWIYEKLGFELTRKELILYGIIAGLGLLLLILLLILLFRKNPEKKAAKRAAKEAAAGQKAAARAEAAEKAAAARAEREAKLAEQKAAQEAKLAEQKAAQEAKRAELKAAQEAKRAELKAAQEAKLAEQKAKLAERKAALEAKQAEQKAAQEEPQGKRFCEHCGAELAPDAAFCENCGTKVG